LLIAEQCEIQSEENFHWQRSINSQALDCLQKHNYQQKKCEHLIDALYECCNGFYKKEGPEAQNVGCPKYDLLQLKMKQRSQGIS